MEMVLFITIYTQGEIAATYLPARGTSNQLEYIQVEIEDSEIVGAQIKTIALDVQDFLSGNNYEERQFTEISIDSFDFSTLNGFSPCEEL